MILVIYTNHRGERVEVCCATMQEAEREKALLAQVGIPSVIEDEPLFTPWGVLEGVYSC